MPSRSPDERRDARASRNEAVSRVDHHAHELWKRIAYRAGKYLSQHHAEIDSQMVHVTMNRYYPNVITHEYKALGPIMLKLARDGFLEKTDRTRKSGQRKNNDRPLAIWRSLKYEEFHDG